MPSGDLLVSISPEEGDSSNDSGGSSEGNANGANEKIETAENGDARSGNGATRAKEGDSSDDLDSNPDLAS